MMCNTFYFLLLEKLINKFSIQHSRHREIN